MTTDTNHHDSSDNGLDRLRAGLVPVGQVRPLLELLDVLRRAGGAEDRASVMYPAWSRWTWRVATATCRVAAARAAGVRDPGGLVVTGPTEGEMFRAARAEAEAFRAAQAARRAVEGRRPSRHGGGACALLLVRNGDQIELLGHAVDSWAVSLDTAGAVELRDALTALLALGVLS